MKILHLLAMWLLSLSATVWAAESTAHEVFDLGKIIIFQDDFRSLKFGKWRLAENDNYAILQPNPDRIQIVDAPGLGAEHKAVRFAVAVHREPKSFRADISIRPHEERFQERWYGERILVPQEWVFDSGPGRDVVMQLHAIPGNWKGMPPNVQIYLKNTHWFINQNYGNAQNRPTQLNQQLADPVQPGCWVSWVIHAKWSPDPDGLLEVWKDNQLVLKRKGTNVYTTLGVKYTPYFKTGLYIPERHFDQAGKQEAFEKENPPAVGKVIYVTDIKIGSEKAKYEDVAPTSASRP